MHPLFLLVVALAALLAVRSIRVAWRAHHARIQHDVAFRGIEDEPMFSSRPPGPLASQAMHGPLHRPTRGVRLRTPDPHG